MNCVKIGNIDRVRGTLDIIVCIGDEKAVNHHATWQNWQEVLKDIFRDNGIPWARFGEFGSNKAYLEF
ncbi:MAG: hypothetical protein ABSG94_10095 [Brevinematales bacterium]|jgi:hypothetical protein